MKEVRYKIVNKSKTGVKVRIGNQIVESTWEEFNKSFKIVDKVYATFNDEMKAKQEKIDAKLDMLTVLARKQVAGTITPADYLMVTKLTEEICELGGFLPVQVIQLVQHRLRQLTEALSDHDLLKKSVKNHRSQKSPESKSVPDNYTPAATMKLGDHPEFEKLKGLFNK